ncbi:hypothetical protein [Streptomyces sp. NBC_00554]|uniref:hypothetical protein n=1 Tax=Streptomyces sp. NBC_00554 TaxID=2903661 RepID=UPI00352F3C6D
MGTDQLLVIEHAGLLLPVGAVHDGQMPEEAAKAVLRLEPDGIHVLRRVAVDQRQPTRRRKVITHIVATKPLAPDDIVRLTYRDPRAAIRVIPLGQVTAHLPPCAHRRTLAALNALEQDKTAYLDSGTIRRTEPSASRLTEHSWQ